MEPEDRDTRSRHRGARVGVLDHAGRRADDVRFGRRQRVEELRRLASMHRVDALALAQLADGRAGRRLDVDVGVTPRPTESLGEPPPGRRLAGAHQAGHDDVFDGAHRHRVAAYTRAMGVQTADRAACDDRHPRWRPARPDARDGGARDGLPGRGARSRSRLPGGADRRPGRGRWRTTMSRRRCAWPTPAMS